MITFTTNGTTTRVLGTDGKQYDCKYDKCKDEFKLPKEAGWTRKTIKRTNIKWDADGTAMVEDTVAVSYVRTTSPKAKALRFIEKTDENREEIEIYEDMWELAQLKYKVAVLSGETADVPTMESVFKKKLEAVKKLLVSDENKKLEEYRKMMKVIEERVAARRTK